MRNLKVILSYDGAEFFGWQVQPDAATAAKRFANEEEAFIYSRFTNPTVTMFERRLDKLAQGDG